LKEFLAKYPKSFKIIYKTIKDFKPDIVITDFEGTVAYIAKTLGYKVICVCNNHSMTKLEFDVPKKYLPDFRETKFIVKGIFPKVDYHLITTFFYPKIRRKDTLLVPSILREPILTAKPIDLEHILVYQTSKSNTRMIRELKRFKDDSFIIYGFGISKTEDNLKFKEFSESGFISDLASCKAAITNGGFSMISEAIYLKKPVFSIPIRNHFEQICNALHLEREGYGKFAEEFSYNSFNEFINNLYFYKEKLLNYSQDGNKVSLSTIDDEITRIIHKKGDMPDLPLVLMSC
jgi:uncharacterized protein (TIGR00661 family)